MKCEFNKKHECKATDCSICGHNPNVFSDVKFKPWYLKYKHSWSR